MDTQKAIDLIEKSEHIAFILPKEPTLDCLVSVEVIARLLDEREKQLGFLVPIIPKNIPRSELFKKTANPALLPKEFIVSLDTSVTPVSQLRYEKKEDRIEVIFSPKSLSLKADLVSFKEGRLLCDCAILFGITDIESLEETFAASPDFFTETPLINIDNEDANKCYGEANLVNTQKTSLAEIIYELVSKMSKEPMDKDSATLLLTGILNTTELFLGESTNADTLLTSSELMRLGADLIKAQELVKSDKPLNILQLAGRASVRSKMDEKYNTLWSFLTAEDFEKTNTSPEDTPSVLHQIEKNFPPRDVKALLWQNPQEKTVHALLAGRRDTLEAIRSHETGEFQSPYLLLQIPFTSFQDAETRISLLLEEVL